MLIFTLCFDRCWDMEPTEDWVRSNIEALLDDIIYADGCAIPSFSHTNNTGKTYKKQKRYRRCGEKAAKEGPKRNDGMRPCHPNLQQLSTYFSKVSFPMHHSYNL